MSFKHYQVPGGPYRKMTFDPRFNNRYDNLYANRGLEDDYREGYLYTDNDIDSYANNFSSNMGNLAHSNYMSPRAYRAQLRAGQEFSPESNFQNPLYLPPWMRTPLHHPFEGSNGELISPEVSYHERKNLMRNFRSFDEDGNGRITPRELRDKLLNSDGTPFEPSTIRLLFELFDADGSNSIELPEFYGLMKSLQFWNQKFKEADVDASGTINFTEYLRLLRYFGYTFNTQTCAYIFKKFARFDRLHRRTRTKLVLKFDRFFECFMYLTFLYNKYSYDGQGMDIDYYLASSFDNIHGGMIGAGMGSGMGAGMGPGMGSGMGSGMGPGMQEGIIAPGPMAPGPMAPGPGF
ncbi:hypothetical protein DASC09_030050 [Saccharomycopsis crataegensis]|uniref:EF-hand domain-containing protein n=1 Tax=Saccharomycopsis crataegensis TaxID=43959 RepID=A0AAV5QL42_9ASCO|nr:hypothetical protein DASC09_030050 [Saccharomycopsis crataegensis]